MKKVKFYAPPGSYCRDFGPQTETLRRMVELTGGELRTEEENWLVPVTRHIFNRLVGLPIGLPGTRYWHFLARKLLGLLLFIPFIVVRVFLGKMPELPHDKWAKADSEVIRRVKQERAAPPMRGMPTAKAFKFFSGIPGFGRLFEDRVVQTIRKILEHDPETVIQFELPAELAFTSAPLPRKMREKIAKRMAASIERIISQLPAGSRFAFHLCWGDLRRRPFVMKAFQRTINKVLLINAITSLSVWEKGWVLFAVHDPHCDGVNMAPEEAAAYIAYEELTKFPPGVIYALGVLHREFTAKATAAVVKIMEPRLARVGVHDLALAPNCGDGREDEAEVLKQWAIAREVADLLNAA